MPKSSDLAPKKTKKAPVAKKAAMPEATTEQVAAYLRRHPEFFAENPAILDGLEPPLRNQGNGVIDLQQAMVKRQRAELERVTGLRDELLAVGRNNQAIQERVHRAILALLDARSFEQFIEAITTDLAIILDLDLIVIGVEQSDENFARQPPPRGIVRLPAGHLEAIFGPSSSILLDDDTEGDAAIFGAGAGLVTSQALIRLNISQETPRALLALGSRKHDQFKRGQGTELMGFIARVVESTFRSWLDLTPR